MSRWRLAKVPRNRRWLAWLLVAVWIQASSSDHGEHLAGSEPFDPVWFSGEADQTNGDVVLIPNGLFRTQHLFAKDRRGSCPLVLFPQASQLALLVPSSRALYLPQRDYQTVCCLFSENAHFYTVLSSHTLVVLTVLAMSAILRVPQSLAPDLSTAPRVIDCQ